MPQNWARRTAQDEATPAYARVGDPQARRRREAPGRGQDNRRGLRAPRDLRADPASLAQPVRRDESRRPNEVHRPSSRSTSRRPRHRRRCCGPPPMAWHSRVNSSMTLRSLMVRPLAVWSNWRGHVPDPAQCAVGPRLPGTLRPSERQRRRIRLLLTRQPWPRTITAARLHPQRGRNSEKARSQACMGGPVLADHPAAAPSSSPTPWPTGAASTAPGRSSSIRDHHGRTLGSSPSAAAYATSSSTATASIHSSKPSAHRGLENRLQLEPSTQCARLAQPQRVRPSMDQSTPTPTRIAAEPTIGVPSRAAGGSPGSWT